MPVGDAACRAVIGGIQNGDAITHALRGHGEHTAKLAST
jgi:hypothetical protein